MPLTAAARVRILVVDDSASARGLICALIGQDPRLIVCGEAADGREAVAQAERLRPTLITMDLRMPVLDGLGAITEIMDRCATRILVVSDCADAANAMDAIGRGALDATAKPAIDEGRPFTDRLWLLAGVPVIRHLRRRDPAPADARGAAPAAPRPGSSPRPPPEVPARPGAGGPVIAVAASTGGPAALARLLPDLPAGLAAPVLIAQHIADGFAQGMAAWLANLCALPVTIAGDGEAAQPGRVYLADPLAHLTLGADGRLHLIPRVPTDRYRPDCDRLLSSVATAAGRLALGVILTGMGRDGAAGIAAIAAAGGHTVAQDEATSVIFGMNREAIARGGVRRVLALGDIAAELVRFAGTGATTGSPPGSVPGSAPGLGGRARR